jgi:PAS domain-containing protein
MFSKERRESIQEIEKLRNDLESFRWRDKALTELREVYYATSLEFDKFLQAFLPHLSTLTRSNGCAFYAVNHGNKLVLKHSIGFGKNLYSEFDLSLGEGFVGQFASQNETTVIHEIPDDTIYIVRTFLGKIKPRSIMTAPVFHQGKLYGLLVTASIFAYSEAERELVDIVRYDLGVAAGSGINVEKMKRMANELTFQNKLIQDQHEEMRNRLKDKEQLLSCLVTSLCDGGIFILDEKGKVLYWSKGAEALLGVSANSTVGYSLSEIEPIQFISSAIQAASIQGSRNCCTWSSGYENRRQYELLLTYMTNDAGKLLGVLVRVE